MADLTTDDIRASVAAGVIDEAQAAQLLVIAQNRQGFRTNMADEDEPFELFKGFSEIFVTVGLALLTAGLVGLTVAVGNWLLIPLISAGMSVLFARYFTLKRRMTLPSIFLASTFASSMFVFLMTFLVDLNTGDTGSFNIVFVATAAALIVYYRIFKVPFTMLLIGLCGVGLSYSLAGLLLPELFVQESADASFRETFDVGASPLLAFTLLGFGLAAFASGMWFDLRDPHRISRHSASAFWLHILAAPAIVNVVAISLLAVGGSAGYLLAAAALVLIALVALIIDRRSFLTAGIIYIGVILTWALSATDVEGGWAIIWSLLIMGGFITGLGTWWVQLRTRLMLFLPDFPLKSKLPPYPEAT